MKVKKLNEDILLEWPWGDKLAKARKKETKSSNVNVKNIANKVLSKDFAKEANMYKFFINGEFTKAYTQDQWKSMFLDASAYLGKPDLSKEQHEVLRQWWEAVVTTATGVLIRRGIENVEKEYVKIQPNVNTKIAEKYLYNTVFDISEEGTSEDDSTDEVDDTTTDDEVSDSDSDDVDGHEDDTEATEAEVERKAGVTKKGFSNFLRLAYTLKLKIFDAMGNVMPTESAGDLMKFKFDQIADYTVEHNGKKHELVDFIKTLVKNKALTEEMLNEKGWSMKIDTNLAHRFRSIIQSDETDYVALKQVIIEVYENIHRLVPDRFEEYELDDIKDDLEYIDTEVNDDMDEEELEDEWNYALGNLYDLCDSYNIWIPLEFEESLEESLTEETAWDKLVKVYPELEEKTESLTLNDDKDIDASKSLTEAPIVTLNDDDIMNPNKIDFKDKIAKATAEEEAAKAKADREAKIADLRVKHADLLGKVTAALDDGTKPSDVLEILFDALVPGQGKCETVAGEITRAMMRILYRWYNDGDRFFQGYGLETCASSAQYLYDNCDAGVIEIILENTEDYDESVERNSNNPNDDRYEQKLEELTRDVINHILENPDLISEPNEDDILEYDNDLIADKEPRYELEVGISDDVRRLLDAEIINAYDLQGYVEEALEYDSLYNGCEFSIWSNHSDTVLVSELSIGAYRDLEEKCSYKVNKFSSSKKTHLELFWEDFVEQYRDELNELENAEEDYDEFEDDEDYDSDDDLGEAFSKNFPIEECDDTGYDDSLEESYDENFTTYDETIESMNGNDNEEVIDAHIRMLDKVVRQLKTTKDDLTIYIDTEGMYNPAYIDSVAKPLNKVITEYNICDGIMTLITRKSGRGDVVLYFKNKTDARQYLKFVDKENGIV